MTIPRLSVAVMTHPSRIAQLESLKNQIGDQIDYQIFIDDQNLGIWENAKRAWRAYDSQSDYHMVLQDDILLSKNFFSVAKRLIANVLPGDSISFCDSLNSEMALAEQSGYHWVTSTKVRHGQCLVQPVSQIENFIHFCDWFIRPDYDHDDGRLEMFLFKHKKAMWHSVPSLVEHDDKGSVGANIKSEPYLGYKFIGQNNEADPKDWGSNHVGFRPASLRMVDKWAIGEINITHPEDFPGHEMFTKQTATIPYEIIIEQARIDRGVTTPYIISTVNRSNALARPCADGDPCD